MIVFDNVSFSYGKRQVLRDVSLSIDARERMAILGGSGDGRPPSN
jgi:ABC-type multidrug transport system fused ATPase/permease subunit